MRRRRPGHGHDRGTPELAVLPSGVGGVRLLDGGGGTGVDPLVSGQVQGDQLAQQRQVEEPAEVVVPFAPDLAVEVVSPSDRPAEVAEKVETWLATGARMVWVAEPRNRTVTIHVAGLENRTLTAEETLEGGEILPGFTCKVSDFFD